MSNITNTYTISCVGCLSESSFTSRERAGAHLQGHRSHLDLVTVAQHGWHLLESLLDFADNNQLPIGEYR